jgi:hypothetical protein
MVQEGSYVKLNVDAAFHNDCKAGATNAVLRNAKGGFIASSSMPLPNVHSSV